MAGEAERREQAAEAVQAAAAVRGPVAPVEAVVIGLREVAVLEELAAEAGVERLEERGPVDARAVQSACLLCPFDSLPTLLVGGREGAGGAFRAGARRRW